MKQVFHIFQKDARHHWPEIMASLALLVVYTWNEPTQWAPQPWDSDIYSIVSNVLSALLPASWCFLIVRVTQAESLVGNRQFWVTRPYDWRMLLAAKILFVIAFVNIPWLMADVVLLRLADFRLQPTYAAGLVTLQAPLTLVLMLTIAALAAVASSVVQVVLALLAVVIYLIGVAIVHGHIPSHGLGHETEPIQGALCIAGCCAVIIWQYARRRTVGARFLLVAIAVAIFLIVVITPYAYLAARDYPLPGTGKPAPMRLELIPPNVGELDQAGSVDTRDRDKNVQIELPLKLSGIAPDSVVRVDGARLALNGPNSVHWDSGWESHSAVLLPVSERLDLWFKMKGEVFDRVKSLDLIARLSVAAVTLRDGGAETVLTSDAEFQVSRVGICRIQQPSSGSIQCRYALVQSSPVLVETASSENTCRSKVPPPPGKIAYHLAENNNSGPLSSVGLISFHLWQWQGAENAPSPIICKGTPIRFSFPETMDHVSIEIALTNFHVADYRYSSRIESFKPR